MCEIITDHYDDETPSSTTLQGRLSNGLDYDFEINESEYIGQRVSPQATY